MSRFVTVRGVETVVANVSGKVRREKLNGRTYLVAPLTMLKEQVLNGSEGPLFYPAAEWRRYPGSWNGMPLVLRHPVDAQGNPVTAREPAVLEQRWVGNVYRSQAGDALTAEAWFDEAATRAHDRGLPAADQVWPRLNRGEPVELSTGLFTDNVPAAAGATHNGVAYSHVATNYRPDHLAVLPDQRGACSVKDGCGINVVNEGTAMADKPVANCDKPAPNLFTNADDAPEGPGAPDLKKLQKLAQFLEIEVDFKADPLGSAAKISEALEKLQKVLAGKPAKEPEPEPAPAEPAMMLAPAANTKAKPMTEQEWLAAAPAPIRNRMAILEQVETREKQALVERLVANVAGEDRRKTLAAALTAKPLAELQALAELVPAPAEAPPPALTPSYAGLGGGFALNQREELPVLDLEAERSKYDPFVLNKTAKQTA